MLQKISKKYLACILFAFSFLLFVQTIGFDAVWDDERVHLNPTNQLRMDKDIGAFWKEHSGMYIPFAYTTWALVKKAQPKKSWFPFHLLNVLTHSLNGVLLFYLLLLLFKNKSTAFIGSLLFLIHPMQVEAVAWISEFRGLYSAFFCLLSLIFFFNELEKIKTSSLSSFFLSKGYLIAILFFILSLLAKPSAIILPLLIILLSWRFYKKHWMFVAMSMSIWTIPVIIELFLLLVKNPENSNTLWERCLIAGFSLFFYLKKVMVPYPLVACYGYTPHVIVSNSVSFIALLLSVVFTLILIRKRDALPDVYTGFMFFVICLSPVLGFISFEYQKHSNVADRYVYLGMIGLVFFIPAIQKFIAAHTLCRPIAVSILIVFSILNVKQTANWKNELNLWNHTLKFYANSPHVFYNRGVQYSLKGNYTQAINDYSSALALDPYYLNALFNRANAYENQNKLAAAFNDYTTYIKKNAQDGSVYYKRSYLYYRTGHLDKAFDDLQKAEMLKFPADKRYKKLLLDTKFK